MNAKNVEIKLGQKSHQYSIQIGHDLLKNCGNWAKDCLSENTRRTVVISNPKVFKLYGETLLKSLENSGFEVIVWLMKDGEKYKNLRSFEAALSFLSEKKITRNDAVIALGGGVVGDLTGFVASVYLRGISFLQIPTTLLSMIDSSVGGKTGVNSRFGKNLIGTFYQPNGVLIDVSTLKTLPKRELTAGFCEAVKHGAISSEKLFNQTAEFLQKYKIEQYKKHFHNENFVSDFENLIRSQVSFKAEIVLNDEKEDINRTDAKSRKILNFGHTLGHALEKITDYKYFKHGEAVGYGILFASKLSKTLELISQNELKSLNDVLCKVGGLPEMRNIDLDKVIEAFSFDKKTTGKSLQWILLSGIGKPKIVSSQDIPLSAIKESLVEVLQK
ncbi:MAG TPA: 3-dehydroquinate synthase [Pyrinomonadaceae bacterium]|nr:3-dehydroquinate synthase [Pyrinomonadaceae bacterium]